MRFQWPAAAARFPPQYPHAPMIKRHSSAFPKQTTHARFMPQQSNEPAQAIEADDKSKIVILIVDSPVCIFCFFARRQNF
jgi:hypothetical protein